MAVVIDLSVNVELHKPIWCVRPLSLISLKNRLILKVGGMHTFLPNKNSTAVTLKMMSSLLR